jgi:hypothetical protein
MTMGLTRRHSNNPAPDLPVKILGLSCLVWYNGPKILYLTHPWTFHPRLCLSALPCPYPWAYPARPCPYPWAYLAHPYMPMPTPFSTHYKHHFETTRQQYTYSFKIFKFHQLRYYNKMKTTIPNSTQNKYYK